MTKSLDHELRAVVIRLLLCSFFASFFWILSGCETTGGTSATQQRRETTIPWNRPASWEGPGALGAGMPGTL